MTPVYENDVASVSIHLNELKNKFDQCMRNGDEISDARKLYMQIKELECLRKAMTWDPWSNTNSGGVHFSS